MPPKTRRPLPSPEEPTPEWRRAPSREGKKVVGIYVDRRVWLALRAMAVEEESSLQALGEEAFDDLLLKRGRRLPPPKG